MKRKTDILRTLTLIASILLIAGKASYAEETIKCLSFETCLKLAEKGDARAQYELGVMYSEGEEWFGKKESKEAIDWYKKAADQGIVDAQFRLGVLYRFGVDVSKDYDQALKWTIKAAEQGHAGAQANLAGMYYEGEGVPRDLEQAEKWYLKAAEQGHDLAIERLGQMR